MIYPSGKRIVFCLWTLPGAGLLAILGLVLRQFAGLPGEDLASWAKIVSSVNYFNGQVLYILAYLLPFLGFWALYIFLARQKMETLAFWGLAGTLFGTALPLATLGVFAYASPELGKLYLQGAENLPQVITDIAMGPSMPLGMTGALLYVTGCTLFGIGVWKSAVLPKWPAAVLVLHGLLISFGFASPPMLVLSWLCLALFGLVIIPKVKKELNK